MYYRKDAIITDLLQCIWCRLQADIHCSNGSCNFQKDLCTSDRIFVVHTRRCLTQTKRFNIGTSHAVLTVYWCNTHQCFM